MAFEDLVYAGRYTSLADVIDIYGRANAELWSVMDSADETETLARVTRAIDDAEDHIDDVLRGGLYTVPFSDSPTPPAINRLASMLAGVMLYEARGSLDVDPTTGIAQHRLYMQKRNVSRELARIKSGRRILALTDQSTMKTLTPFSGPFDGTVNNCECD